MVYLGRTWFIWGRTFNFSALWAIASQSIVIASGIVMSQTVLDIYQIWYTACTVGTFATCHGCNVTRERYALARSVVVRTVFIMEFVVVCHGAMKRRGWGRVSQVINVAG